MIKNKDYRAVWFENGVIKVINQTLLPYKFEIVSIENYNGVVNAISSMVVRGAPSIGAVGAYGLAQAINQLDKFDVDEVKRIKDILQSTRPTGYDLKYALDFVFNIAIYSKNPKEAAIEAAESYVSSLIDACRRIGKFGERVIKDGMRILTHCNAGALATVDYGTALAPIRMAYYNNKKIFVFVDETRPRLQGSRLTAWELSVEGIPYAIIPDNAAGYYMRNGEIGLVIVGADRIAVNGDVANKIGTYEKAVLAKENNIPFYVAAPISTFDFNCKFGDDTPIEEREEDEVLSVSGFLNGRFSRVRIAPAKSKARNPAFDITPANYITGYITEVGIIGVSDIKTLAKRRG